MRPYTGRGNNIDYEKRKRHNFRENAYEGTDKASKQLYKNKRETIKRKYKSEGTILRDYSGRAMIRTSYSRKAIENGFIQRNIPTDQMRDDFFSLLDCMLISLKKSYKNNCNAVRYNFSKIDKGHIEINQINLAHILGMTGILNDRSPLYRTGISPWEGLTPLERLEVINQNKTLIAEYEKKYGRILNYAKAQEKLKNLFIFDPFNSKKEKVYAIKLSQTKIDEQFRNIIWKSQTRRQWIHRLPSNRT